MKLPSFQFYPGDWMKDPSLRSVSYAARGFWIDLLCLMFESQKRGYLQHENGNPITKDQLARMTGGSAKQIERLLKELEESGVFSRTEQGVIYSRRIVREEQLRKKQVEFGKQGGNPALKGGLNPPDKVDAKANPTPSSSSSVSSSPSGITPPIVPQGDGTAREIPKAEETRALTQFVEQNPPFNRSVFPVGWADDVARQFGVVLVRRCLGEIFQKATNDPGWVMQKEKRGKRWPRVVEGWVKWRAGQQDKSQSALMLAGGVGSKANG